MLESTNATMSVIAQANVVQELDYRYTILRKNLGEQAWQIRRLSQPSDKEIELKAQVTSLKGQLEYSERVSLPGFGLTPNV